MSIKELSIIQMNDTHAYLEEHYEYFFSGNNKVYKKVGGYSKIYSYVEDIRNKNERVLFLDGGDTFHGTYKAVKTKGHALIKPLNKLGLDAMTAHWEFGYGPENFKEILSKLNYPMLSINTYYEENNELVFDPYLIKNVQGLKVGIIGIAATIIDKVMPKYFSEGLYFTLGDEELPKYIHKLRNKKQVDLVLVISHLGFPQDQQLASDIDGIDVLLSAHTHNRIYKPIKVNDTIIIQSGCHGSFLGHLDLVIEDKSIIDFNYKLVTLDETIEENKEMKKIIDDILNPDRKYLNKKVGNTKTNLDRSFVLESTMDNWLLR